MAYTEEEINFIKANVVGITYKELTDRMNEKFGTNRNFRAVKGFCNKSLKVSNYIKKWSDEEKQFLIDNCKGNSYKWLAEEVSKIKGIKRTAVNTRNECYFLGVHNGIDMKFQKGHKGNPKPIGHEIRQGRKTYVKVTDEFSGSLTNRYEFMKNYRLKHELLYEQHYGEIPKGWYVVFADGNRQNFDVSNLVCIPNSVKQTMNTYGWQFLENAEMRKTALKWCVLDKLLKDRRNSNGRKEISI